MGNGQAAAGAAEALHGAASVASSMGGGSVSAGGVAAGGVGDGSVKVDKWMAGGGAGAGGGGLRVEGGGGGKGRATGVSRWTSGWRVEAQVRALSSLLRATHVPA